MRAILINEYKDQFKAFLEKEDTITNDFYFEIINNWQQHWNIESRNLSQVYDSSLQSSVSARLWGGSVNSPKSLMISLLNTEEDFMRATFRDLFNERLDIGLRLDRFAFHTDQVFKALQTKDPKLISHFHDDRKILCLYLALEYPAEYCLFDYDSFHKMMTKFESRNIPTEVEVERYYKSCRGIFKLISKDEELIPLFKSKCKFETADIGLMLMSIFMEFVANAS